MGEWHEGLNARWRRFVEAYCSNGFHITNAAITAGYSERTAHQQGSRLLKNVKIVAAVNALLSSQAMTSGELLARIADDARASIGEFITVNDYGEPSLNWDAAREAGALRHVREFTVHETQHGSTVKFKLVDDQRAKEQLLKAYGLTRERLEISGPGGAPVTVQTLPVGELSDAALGELERALEAQLAAQDEEDDDE